LQLLPQQSLLPKHLLGTLQLLLNVSLVTIVSCSSSVYLRFKMLGGLPLNSALVAVAIDDDVRVVHFDLLLLDLGESWSTIRGHTRVLHGARDESLTKSQHLLTANRTQELDVLVCAD